MHGTGMDQECLWGGMSVQWASMKCRCSQATLQLGLRREPWWILCYLWVIGTWGKNGVGNFTVVVSPIADEFGGGEKAGRGKRLYFN